MSITRIVVIIMITGLTPVLLPAAENLRPNLRLAPLLGSGTWNQAEALPQAAGAEKLPPLSKQQLLDLVSAGVSSQRAAELIRDRGIDFQADDDYIRTLQRDGATDVLISALRKISVPMEGITVETDPDAQILLDGNPQGRADSHGVLVIRAKAGPHTLKVLQAGKQDFQQRITFEDGQPVHVVAPLAGLAAAVRVRTLPGANIWLDDSLRGTADASGEILITNIPAGAHAMRVTAHHRMDASRDIVVAAGPEMAVNVALADSVQSNPQDGLKYAWIAPGRFLMGCSTGDIDCAPAERPAHPVSLQNPFWIGQTEVTARAYKGFVAAGKVRMPPAAPKQNRGWKIETLPIVDMTWDEASQYCGWAGGRLPSEAEWEFAARGGNPQARYGVLDDIAWSKENAENQSHVVGGKQPNPYGLFDTLGNVWEWVNDWYDQNYYQNSPAQDPKGPASGERRVLRGGSWIVDPKLLRVSERYNIQPDARSEFFGFRCVWEAKIR